jgi:Winged helix DNA-binding domain
VRITDGELNRALLARQGLLDRLDADVVEAAGRIGAIQAQYWPAVATALASRVGDFSLDRLYAAFEAGALVTGSLLRGTLHTVPAAQHPAYAVVAQASGATDWRRRTKEPCPAGDEVRAVLARELSAGPADRARVLEVVEGWFAAHPGAVSEEEAAFQRSVSWRPLLVWSGLVRVAAPGAWAAPKGPEALRAAPCPPHAAGAPGEREAIDAAVRRHLAAFGPSGPEDVAQWLGTRVEPVQAALRRAEGLEVFENEYGRRLYDLPEAPRPGAGVPAPVRLLAPFDSVLLAYLPKRRERLLAEGVWERVYRRAGLKVDPTFLVDGMVAGTWGVKASARKAVLTLMPFDRPGKDVRAQAEAEADRMLSLLYPAALYPAAVRSVVFEQ